MSGIATAVVGGAVISAYASNRAAKTGSQAVERGTQASVQAQLEATRLQIGEIQRQFDYQQRVLRPLVEQQYRAQGTFADLLGIPAPGPQGQPAGTGFQETARPVDVQQQRRQQEIDILQNIIDDPTASASAKQTARDEIEAVRARPYDAERIEQEAAARGPQAAPPGSYGLSDRFRGPQGEFVDPNLDPTRLADINTLGETVRGNLLAGTPAGEDPYRAYIDENRIAAATPEDDLRVARARDVTLASGAAGTGVYGETFEESPGYAFQREELERQLERGRSRGGNFGGRAIIEAQRRAQGLAAGEYYRYAAGRERDLLRLGEAEARDVARGDEALAGYEAQRFADVQRGDEAYQNYLARRAGDAARLDAAAQQEDQLLAADLQRRDQAYYNYLSNLAGSAGFGNPAGQAVQASQAAGGAVAGAYGQLGAQQSRAYQNLGTQQAAIQQNRFAGINQAIQGGLSNYFFARGAGLVGGGGVPINQALANQTGTITPQY